MNYFQAIFLSIIEGATEFLPISSTGHLILTSEILKIPQTDFIKSFEIFIQLGAILAIVVLYWQTLLHDIKIWGKITVAFLPTAILGFAFYKFIKDFLLGNTLVTLTSLFMGGIVFILFERIYQKDKQTVEEIGQLSYQKAFLIGIFQSISMIPGVSRSAATIFGGLFLGLKRKTAVEFSFLLAVPTMLAATALDLYKNSFNFDYVESLLLIAGFIGAFITALITVKYFLRFIQNHTFVSFGIYRIILAVAFWIFL